MFWSLFARGISSYKILGISLQSLPNSICYVLWTRFSCQIWVADFVYYFEEKGLGWVSFHKKCAGMIYIKKLWVFMVKRWQTALCLLTLAFGIQHSCIKAVLCSLHTCIKCHGVCGDRRNALADIWKDECMIICPS